MRFLVALIVVASPAIAQQAQRTAAQERQMRPSIDTVIYSKMRWRYIGPEGNRTSAVAGVPGDPNVYYAGAASGGIFKSTDGGVHWSPIFDGQPVSSIGALAVAPSDANVVYAGTGEPFIRSNISVGWGMFRSTDAGKTWSRAGLESTGRIARVVVHPTNPDVVYAAALGHAYGPQPERGIFRSSDGGKTWDRVLFVNDSVGASDLVMDPSNPRILYAGTWQIEIHTWGRTSGGAGSGIWKSADGGTTWKRLTGPGLPKRHIGKVGLGISRANPGRLYALIETGDGVPLPDGRETETGRLFRSDDGGDNWVITTHDREVAGRTHYYNRFAVSPDNADEAYFATSSWSKTVDGGRTVTVLPFAETPGFDHHDIWIDPLNGNRMVSSHDGGVSVTTNRGKSWIQTQLPIAQIYHVNIDNRVPYNVYGNRQDGPSVMIPSNSRLDASFFGSDFPTISRGHAVSVGGGESGWATPDTVDGTLVWSSASGFGSVGGIVSRYDRRTQLTQNVEVWPQATIGWPADSLRYRFVWTFPVTLSKFDNKRLYVGSQHVHVTADQGRTWQVISPDLTRNDKARQRTSGGLTPDNIGVEYAGVLFAIAESPLDRNLLWTGSNDGLVHVSRDGGSNWTNVTANIPGLLTWGTISNIEPSRFDAGTAYLTVDGHQVNNRDPWVYRTTDFGRTWRLITSGLPKNPVAYAHFVKEDPVRRGMLYLGTEGGIYVSFDDGESWQTLQNNLPRAPVYGIVVQPNYQDLVIATYGRGFWILDDITALRHLSPRLLATDAHLFAPRATYRLRDAEQPFSMFYDPSAGFNPPYGAPLNYYLKAGSDSTVRDSAGVKLVSKDSVTFTISDAAGAVVRTLKGPVNAGMNRVYWNLRGDLTKQPKLRTPPEYAPWFAVQLEGRNAPSMNRVGVLMLPGTYSVKLTTPTGYSETQQLVVRKDPNVAASDAELAENVAMARDLTRQLDEAVTMINSLEAVRGQLAALKATLGDDSTRKDVVSSADSLDLKLRAVERRLFNTRITGRGQDLIRWPMRLAEQIEYLVGSVQSSDHAPTAAQREVGALLRDQLQAVKAEYDRVMQREVAAFNAMLQQRRIPNVIISN
ncbi:MAG: WD40/YVTN/BNR-like repeat-containing protein [Gemmatimonadaceae bacterium]